MSGQLFLKDVEFPKHHQIEIVGREDTMELIITEGYEVTSIYLDEGSINELYEFLGEWIDVR